MLARTQNIRNKSLLTATGLILAVATLFVRPSNTLAQNTNRARAINLVRQAAAAYERGDSALTIRYCRQAIALDPKYPRAYTWLGAAQQRRGERANACSAFAKVVKLAPKTPDATRATRGLRELKCGGATPTPTRTRPPVVSPLNPTPTATPTPIPTATPTPTPIPAPARLESNWSVVAGVSSLAFSADGSRLAGSLSDGTWRLWRTKGGELEKLDRGDSSAGSAVASGRSSYALGTVKGSVLLFNAIDGRKLKQFEARSGSVSGLDYSPDNEFLAIAGMDNAIKIFDVRSESMIESISSGDAAIFGVEFSPNSRQLAVGIGSKVRIYNASNWKATRTLDGDQLPVGAIAWSRDGALLAIASGYEIRVFETKNYRLVRTLSGHKFTICSLAFGNDSLLASGGFDSQLRLWDASNGASKGSLAYHTGQIRGLCFDSSGKRLASGDHNGTIAIWQFP